MLDQQRAIDGIMLVDKPADWTSHDVVGRMRRITGIRRIGHAGTLDPLATGLLPLGVGQGTRVLDCLSAGDKWYVAGIRLGVETDTYDADGTALQVREWSHVAEPDVRTALSRLEGEYDQRPPMFSAIKRGGVPLHRLARAGQAVDVPLRRVAVYSITLMELRLPEISIEVHCSKGTYIRSLAHDLGERLGTGAHVTSLRRTAAGRLRLDDARTMEQWERSFEDGTWPARVLPIDTTLLQYPAVILSEGDARRLADGVAPRIEQPTANQSTSVRAYGPDGTLYGVVRWLGVERGWKAEKVFVGR
jgi:tRNA pseudouridine55 synthase